MIRKSIIFLTLAGLCAFGSCVHAADNKDNDLRWEVKQLNVDLKNVTHDIESLRKDQLNYRIEKDLLKEAYSSNIQTINMAITMVLGFLGVLGYLGIRSIKEVRTDYTAELEKLRQLKTQLESEIESLRSKQKDFENQVGNLSKTNDDQNRRLRIMELIEKVSSLQNGNQWKWSLNYIDIGLGLDPKNTILLAQKSLSFSKLGELTSAIDAIKQLLSLEPENFAQATNLLEFFALTNQREEFEKYYAQYKNEIESRFDGGLATYINSLLNIMSGQLEDARTLLLGFIEKMPEEPKKYFENWSFEEARTAAAKMPTGWKRTAIENLTTLLNGQMAPAEFRKILVDLKI